MPCRLGALRTPPARPTAKQVEAHANLQFELADWQYTPYTLARFDSFDWRGELESEIGADDWPAPEAPHQGRTPPRFDNADESFATWAGIDASHDE